MVGLTPEQEQKRNQIFAQLQGQRHAALQRPNVVQQRFQALQEVQNRGRATPAQANFTAQREADGLWDSFVAGFENSVTGLKLSGEAPERIVSEHASTAERLLSNVGTLIGDIPTYVIGGVAGGIGGSFAAGPGIGTAVGAGAGGMALTEGARTWMLEQYAQGASERDVADRLATSAYAAVKGAALGGATAGVGAKVAKLFKPAAAGGSARLPDISSAAGRSLAATPAEVATLVGVQSALEQEMPGKNDFIDAAVLLGGVKVGTFAGGAAGKKLAQKRQRRRDARGEEVVAGEAPETVTLRNGFEIRSDQLKEIYRRTGKSPREVARAAQKDPQLFEDLTSSDYVTIPQRYRHLEESPLRIDPRKMTPEEILKNNPQLVDIMQHPLREQIAARNGERALVNWDKFDLRQGPDALAREAQARFKQEFLDEKRLGTSVEETVAKGREFLSELLGEKSLKTIYRPGSAEWAAEMAWRSEVAYAAADRMWRAKRQIQRFTQRGEEPPTQVLVDGAIWLERFNRLAAVLEGRASEASRALGLLGKLKKVRDETSLASSELADALRPYGGRKGMESLATVVAETSSPRALGNIARKGTTFERIVEGWKAFILSGPETMQVNLMGNQLFGFMRIPESYLAVAIGQFRRGSKDRVMMHDATAAASGWVWGNFAAVRQAGKAVRANMDDAGWAQGLWESFRSVDVPKKAELLQRHRPAIPGVMGEVVRTPFKMLQLGDQLGRSAMRNSALYQLSTRQALNEGLTFGTLGFKKRVNQLVTKPTRRIEKEADALAERFVLMEEGPVTKGFEKLREHIPALQFVIPFLKAPTAIFREFSRRSPLAPVVRAWRRDVEAGGAKRDQAMAEMLGGSAIGTVFFVLAREGILQGAGHPDDQIRAAQYNAGYQPYSIKFKDGSQLTINRWEPVGTMMGLASDIAQSYELMTEGEQENAIGALIFAGTEIVKNKTWLQGVANIINAIEEPERFGPRMIEGYVSSAVPNLIGQTASEFDPYVREIDSIKSAVKARIPGLRGTIPVRRDGFGEPIESTPGAWPFSPSSIRQASDDPVRTEAERLGVRLPPVPKSLHAGSLIGQPIRVDLSTEERLEITRMAGQQAYEIMARAVNSPGWGRMPDLVKKKMFRDVFSATKRRAHVEVLPPEERQKALRALMEQELLQ